MYHLCESVDTSLQDICHQQKETHLFMELRKNKDNDF